MTPAAAPGRLRRALGRLGIDRPIAHTLVGHGGTAIAGPVTVVVIATLLSPEQQGYFYTFLSLSGLNVVFELGLSYVVMQFAAHESASLSWDEQRRTLAGDPARRARLGALFHKAVRWYAVAAVAMSIALVPAGLVFFARTGAATAVGWRGPWVLTVLAVSLNLALTPGLAVLEGSGRVAEVAFMRSAGNIVKSVALWAGLGLRLGLFSVCVMNVAQGAWLLGSLARDRRFFADLWRERSSPHDFDWWREVWPFQWKLALSWLSGYFLFQLFTPLTFAFAGAVAAGQVGMSIYVTNAVLTVGMAWIQTKGAPFGKLIARRDFDALDRVFFRAMGQSFAVVALGQASFWLAVYGLKAIHHPLAHRVLDPLPLALLAATALANQVIFSEALYLRAHKEEPFLWPSVIGAAATAALSYALIRSQGVTAMMLGNFLLTLVGIPLSTWILTRKRRLWHG